MIIVALDLATSTGLCIGRPDTTPRAYAIRAPATGPDYGLFGGFFWRHFDRMLRGLVAELQPGEKLLVVYEAPILPPARYDKKLQKMVGGTNIQTTRKLQGLGMLLETVCDLLREQTGADIDARETSVASIKSELTGRGNADKSQMIMVARRAGISLPEGAEAADAADAFGIFVLAVRLHAKEWSAAWDKRLYSPEGPGRF